MDAEQSSASYDGTSKVWDVYHERELHTLRGHTDCVKAVAITADGLLEVWAPDDSRLKVWDVESGHERHTLQGHAGPVCSVALNANGRYAVSASLDKTIRVWDPEIGVSLASFSCGWITVLLRVCQMLVM